MDHLVHKELAGWSHPKSCGKRLDVQVESSDEWCSIEAANGTGTV